MTNRGMAHVHGATRSAEGVPKQPRVSMFQWRRYQRIRIVAELARCSKNGEFRFLFCVVSRQGRERKKERKKGKKNMRMIENRSFQRFKILKHVRLSFEVVGRTIYKNCSCSKRIGINLIWKNLSIK